MSYLMSATLTAIKCDNRSINSWAKKHGFSTSLVNDMFSRRGPYTDTAWFPNLDSVAYRILYTALQNGYSNALMTDGWDITRLTILPVTKPLSSHQIDVLDTAMMDISGIGDEYTCTVFKAVSEGGPIALLLFLEGGIKVVATAIKLLTVRFPQYSFYKQTDEVITIWYKE